MCWKSVCNKHRAPKTEEEIEKERVNAVENVSPVQVDSDDDCDAKAGQSKKESGSKFGAKQKRKSIKQTKCPAKMIVKLINNKWDRVAGEEDKLV